MGASGVGERVSGAINSRLLELQDNLGVRLLLLERRLAERARGLRIERTGRGRFRLCADVGIELP